jgi:glycosyltransferase involved in cell wall biosynthesis
MALRCLLLSPVSPPDPRNGDSQYTEDLVRYPPDGVEYVTYTDALARKEIEWGPSLRWPDTLRRPDRLVPGVARAGLHVLRRTRLLLPDAVRWFRIRAHYDVVHVHYFPVRFLGPRPPVILSDSGGAAWYWIHGTGASEARVERLLRRERAVARIAGYLHSTANPDGEALVFWIEAGKRLAERIGVDASTATVCAPGVPPARYASIADGRTVLFVGSAFQFKGGPEALEIFGQVQERLPAARLLIAGPEHPYAEVAGVEWLGYVSRDRLYADIYPKADVFLYPTKVDTAPLVVQEALAHGIPVVAPRAMGLPDLVRHGETGFLFEQGDLATATTAVVALLEDKELLARSKRAALIDYEDRFSVDHRNHILGSLYQSLAA